MRETLTAMDLRSGLSSALNAFGYAGAMIRSARQVQAGMGRQPAFDLLDQHAMADVILGDGLSPAIGAGKDGSCRDAHDLCQFLARNLNQSILILFGQILRKGAADEDPQKHTVLRRAMLELG